MTPLPTLARIYRLGTGEKVGSTRLLCYAVLGFVVSGEWFRIESAIDLLVVAGGVLFASLLNDYNDHALRGEANAVGDLLDRGELSKSTALVLIWAPWLVALAALVLLLSFEVSSASLIMLWASFMLSWAYSQPPIRLKDRKTSGIVAPPVGIFMIYAQALILTRPPDTFAFTVSASVFVYAWYLDFLHVSADIAIRREPNRLEPERAVAAVRTTAAVGVAVAAVCVVFNGLMIVSVLAWSCRWLAVHSIACEDVVASRKSMLSGIYRIEEFAIIAVFSVFFR